LKAASTLKNADGLFSVIVAKPARVPSPSPKEGLTGEDNFLTDAQKEKGMITV
jgi:hypothetical protein